MKTILNKYNKVYLGDQEITQDSLCIGSDKVGVLHKFINPFRKLGHYEVGDAVLWDNTRSMFKVCPLENITLLDTERYTPTGVVAIPSSHNVYGTGECGIAALLSASLTTPDIGLTSDAYISWFAYGTEYPELNSYYTLCRVGIESGTQGENAIVNNTLTQETSAGSYLPSDAFTADSTHTKAIDGTYYYYNDSKWNKCLPSPYLNNGSRNPVYYQTKAPSSTLNALSDFAGKSNTEFLCSKATAQADWKTATSIIDTALSVGGTDGEGEHPAACTCWRYHTSGTTLGDWYLPACGELGYVCVRSQKINETIAALLSHFGTTLCLLTSFAGYWSSSLSGGYYAYQVNTKYGSVGFDRRDKAVNVRPFTRLK